MEFRTLKLNIVSAKDLMAVNPFSMVQVYVVASLSGDSYQMQKTKMLVDRNGSTNPSCNYPMMFVVNESLARQNRLTLEIKLRTERTLGGETDVGVVHIPVKELLDQSGDGKSSQIVSYQVRKPSGEPKGSLNLWYEVGEKVVQPSTAAPLPTAVNKDKPVMAYLAPGAGSSQGHYAPPYPPPQGAYPHPQPQHAARYGYPPPPHDAYSHSQPQHAQHASGYGYPPPPHGDYGYPPPLHGAYSHPQPQHAAGYGYPPPPQGAYPYLQPQHAQHAAGYGYPPPPHGAYPHPQPQHAAGYGYGAYPPPPQAAHGYTPVQKPPNKYQFEMALAAGLLGRALGGLLMGGMVSHATPDDAGHEAGFDYASGFDF